MLGTPQRPFTCEQVMFYSLANRPAFTTVMPLPHCAGLRGPCHSFMPTASLSLESEKVPTRANADGWVIRAFEAPLGAEVVGLDLAQPLAEADFARLHQAHLDHHVLVLRDQRITPAQQVAFSRRFGALQIHVLKDFQLAQSFFKLCARDPHLAC